MKRQIGFLSSNKPEREKTRYDIYVGKPVRVDIVGGLGRAGNLNYCEMEGHGYVLSLKPSIIYQPDGTPKKSEKEALLESNGNALSIVEIEGSLDDYISEIMNATEKDKPHSK